MSKLIREIKRIIKIAKICIKELDEIPKRIWKTKKLIKSIEAKIKYLLELEEEEYTLLKESLTKKEILAFCVSSHQNAKLALEILEKDKQKIREDEIRQIKFFLKLIINLEKHILEEEYGHKDEPINMLLFELNERNIKISQFTQEELLKEATDYRKKVDGSYVNLSIYETIPEKIIVRDVKELKKILPRDIFRIVYIDLMGRVKRLESNEDEYFGFYVLEKWRKLSREYDTSGLPLPCVIYIGWLLKAEINAEFNGKEIILYLLEEITLIHEMIHYCQFSRNPYKFKSIIFQTEEEIEARKKREIEAYFISQKVVGQPISMQEAEKRAIASMHGKGY